MWQLTLEELVAFLLARVGCDDRVYLRVVVGVHVVTALLSRANNNSGDIHDRRRMPRVSVRLYKPGRADTLGRLPQLFIESISTGETLSQ